MGAIGLAFGKETDEEPKHSLLLVPGPVRLTRRLARLIRCGRTGSLGAWGVGRPARCRCWRARAPGQRHRKHPSSGGNTANLGQFSLGRMSPHRTNPLSSEALNTRQRQILSDAQLNSSIWSSQDREDQDYHWNAGTGLSEQVRASPGLASVSQGFYRSAFRGVAPDEPSEPRAWLSLALLTLLTLLAFGQCARSHHSRRASSFHAPKRWCRNQGIRERGLFTHTEGV